MDRGVKVKRAFASAILAVLLAACGVEIVSKPSRRGDVAPEVSNVLLQLIDDQEKGVVSNADYSSTSLGAIVTLGTPAGLRLKLRYQELGISLVEALKLSRDQDLLERLLELAKWSQRRRVRSEALVTLAEFSDPRDLSHFEIALRDQDVGIRFAAVEALQTWGREEALPLLREAMRDPWSPLIRVFAAQAVVALGDIGGMPVLLNSLNDRSWIVRALAARYLGDHGSPDDYQVLLAAVSRESRNDFVAAEAAISALKLLAKKPEAPAQTRARRPDRPSEGGYSVGADDVVEMEPLVLRPPRLQIPESVRVAQALNNRLIQLIKSRLDLPLDAELENDPNMQDLNRMVTPEGLALQTRYSELSVAVAEGLAGTTDPLLHAELVHLAETNPNSVARATALISLAYARDSQDIPLITRALDSSDAIIRFGAIEAAQIGRFREVIPDLIGLVSSDPVPAFKLYAVQALLAFGDPSARNLLLAHVEDRDWPARAMAYWFLGRYGEPIDYTFALNQFAVEKNPFVLAELALAAQRLAPER